VPRSRNDGVFGQGLESFAVGLNDRDGDKAGFALLDVFDDARFSGMHAANDFAFGAIFEFRGWVIFWLHVGIDFQDGREAFRDVVGGMGVGQVQAWESGGGTRNCAISWWAD
jgi:hypothetical protein